MEARDFKDYGDRFMQSGEYVRAIDCYKTALRIKPDFPWAMLNLGLAYLRLGDDATAERLLLDVLKKNPPGKGRVLMNLAEIMAKRRNWEEAIAYARQAIAEGFELDIGYRRLGTFYSILERWNEARDALDSALAHQLSVTTPYRRMLLQTAAVLTPDSSLYGCVQAGLARGITETEMERYDLTLIRALMNQDRDISKTCHDLGIAYLRLGDESKARELVQRALAIWPDNPVAKQSWKNLQEMQKKAAQ